VGESVLPDPRTVQHNTGYYFHASTSYTNDWELQTVFQVEGRINAKRVERYIKSMKSKNFLWKLIHDEEFRIGFRKVVFEKFKILVW